MALNTVPGHDIVLDFTTVKKAFIGSFIVVPKIRKKRLFLNLDIRAGKIT